MNSINLGLVGAGEIARPHVLAYSSLPVLYGPEISAVNRLIVGEKNEELARGAASKFGFTRWSADWHEVTNDDDVNLVDIVTPPFLHKEVAIDAIEHGKNVICEKPLAPYAKDARAMHDAAKRSGVVNMVGFNHRRLPAVAHAKSLIDSNYIGRIYQIRCFYLEDFATSTEIPLMWRFRSEVAHAGAILEQGSHVIDLLRHFVGQEPKAVCAVSRTLIEERSLENDRSTKKRVDVDDTTMSLLRFENGIIAQIATSWAAHGRKAPHFEFEVNGSEGSLYYDLERPHELQIYSAADRPAEQGFKTVHMGPLHPHGKALPMTQAGTGLGFEDSFISEIHDLVEAIGKGQGVSPSFYDGWKTSQVIDAIVDSNVKAAWVDVG